MILNKKIFHLLKMILFIYIIIFIFLILLYYYYSSEHLRIEKQIFSKYSQKIPFLVLTTHDVHFCKNNFENLIKHNLDYNILFFNENNRIAFIKKYFPNNVINAYNKLIPSVYKADLFRYCFLFIYGGIYIDSNKKLLKPLRYFIQHRVDLGLVLNSNHQTNENPKIINGFIYTVPKHPLFLKTIELVVHNIENNYYGDSCLSITGPYVLGKAFQQIFDKSLFELSTYIVKNHNDTKTVSIQQIKNNIIHIMIYYEKQYVYDFITKSKILDGKKECNHSDTNNYVILWKQRQVYNLPK
jgi:mannosyltransferase OCH1-like enzyme